MTLREYQQRSIDALRNGMRAGYRRQVLALATGAGKTRVAGGLIHLATSKNRRVAFICNRIELVLQAHDAFQKLGIDCGIIQGDNSINTSAPVLVCSIQTIAKRGIPDADLYIIDECHTSAASENFHKLFYSRNNVPFIGLTATPFAKGMAKHHDALSGPLFDNLIVGATIPELITGGYLVDCDIYAPSEPDLTNVKIVAGDYQEDQLNEAVDQPKLVGDIIDHYRRLAEGKKTIVFATSINHSQHIVEAFTRAGYRAKHLDAYTDPDERREIINGFKAGDFEILSNCSLLAEGFDCPQTECIILARPTRSLIRYIQMIGRSLRIHDNISECYNSYRSYRDGIQRGHAMEDGQLSRKHGSDCGGVEVRGSQTVGLQALEPNKLQLLNKEGAYLPANNEPREEQERDGELLYRVYSEETVQHAQAGCAGMGGEQEQSTAGKSQGREQAEQPRRQPRVGNESGKHEARTRAWFIPGTQWRKAREEQTNGYSGDGDKAGTEGISTWIIDPTGTKVRGADNNHCGDKSGAILGACFIAESHEEIEALARQLSSFHKGDESLLVCSASEDTGAALRIEGARRIKKSAIVLDHSGTVRRLGFPTDDLPMVLDDGKTKAKEERQSLPKICKSCFAVRPSGVKVCPQCGFEPTPTAEEIQHEAGELLKVEKKKRDALTMVEKQGIYSALIGFARSKGMKDGWAYHKYNEMLGCYPAGGLDKVSGPMVESVNNWFIHERIKKAKSAEKTRNPHQCPKCTAVNDYVLTPASGPHGPGARCVCGAHWWMPKGGN